MQQGDFVFEGYDARIEQGFVNFHYKIKNGGEELNFVEKIHFEPVSDFNPGLVKQILDSMHLAFGVSYWKIFCSKNIKTPGISLSEKQAKFWNTLYTKGLGEFFYKNNIDFRGLVKFPFSSEGGASPISTERKNRSLVGIGGGKDSVVTGELLKANDKEFAGFILSPVNVQEKITGTMEIAKITIEREIDPLIFELNKRNDVYNGHIPISSMYAFTGLLAAALFDYKYIIVSNEKSANYGNVKYLGEEINHQWSKTSEFETLVQEYINSYIASGITYFSLLRPYHEIKVTEIFSRFEKYFGAFTSCNKNFKINNPAKSLWCGDCAKCAFVFCMLSAFINKEQLVEIFGKNLYESESLRPTYEELLGIREIKPFDCVGTPDETKLAFFLAYKKGSYNNTPIMKMFCDKFNLEFQTIEQSSPALLRLGELDNIPSEFRSVFF